MSCPDIPFEKIAVVSCGEEQVILPFLRVFVYIISNEIVLFIISDDMIIKSRLPFEIHIAIFITPSGYG